MNWALSAGCAPSQRHNCTKTELSTAVYVFNWSGTGRQYHFLRRRASVRCQICSFFSLSLPIPKKHKQDILIIFGCTIVSYYSQHSPQFAIGAFFKVKNSYFITIWLQNNKACFCFFMIQIWWISTPVLYMQSMVSSSLFINKDVKEAEIYFSYFLLTLLDNVGCITCAKQTKGMVASEQKTEEESQLWSLPVHLHCTASSKLILKSTKTITQDSKQSDTLLHRDFTSSFLFCLEK